MQTDILFRLWCARITICGELFRIIKYQYRYKLVGRFFYKSILKEEIKNRIVLHSNKNCSESARTLVRYVIYLGRLANRALRKGNPIRLLI